VPLTSADIRNVTFSKPPIGKRGYHEDEVDAFLDLVGAELARLNEENTNLRNRVEQLTQQRVAAPLNPGYNLRAIETSRPLIAAVPPSRVEQRPPAGTSHAQAAKVLGLAQQIADKVTGEAKAEADGLLAKAHTTAAQLLSDARAKTDGMINEARTRAEAMLDDARTRAETLDRQSQEKAAALERDAARRHSEIIGSISQEKTLLERKTDELRTFEHEYRTRLKMYLESQLRELDGDNHTVPVDPAHDQRGFVASGFGAHTEPGNNRIPDPKIGTASSDSAGSNSGGVGRIIDPWTSVQRSVS